MENSHKVVVIGAGISGLACAYRLKQLGVRPLVIEASDRAGGAIRTVRRDGYIFEMGPQGPRFGASVWKIVRELGLEGEFVAGDPKAARYIVRDGKLERAPFSPGAMLSTGLVGWGSKLRVLSEPFRTTQPPKFDESVAAFVRRKFGDEILDYLVDPIVSTVFLGDAENMGMASAFPALVRWEHASGSIARGALRERRKKQTEGGGGSRHSPGSGEKLKVTDSLPALGSFRDGMETLTNAVAASLREDIRYGAQVVSVDCIDEGDGGWHISLRDGEHLRTEGVVIATPAFAAAEMLRSTIPPLARDLAGTEYAPITVVAAAYKRANVANPLDGFGFMVPRKEGLRTIATFWNSSLFTRRAPDGHVLITAFSRSADDNVDAILAENAKLLGISAPPVTIEKWKSERAMPQYNLEHQARAADIIGGADAVIGLQFAANYLYGRSIGECVDAAFRIADEIASRSGGGTQEQNR